MSRPVVAREPRQRAAGGTDAGVVKTASGNVYAGADGNVYRHTSDGWQKYGDGSWNSVTPPARNTSPGGGAPGSQSPGGSEQRLGQGGGPVAQRFANSPWGQQLEQDRFARTQGDAQQDRFNQWREGGGDGSGERFGEGHFANGGNRFSGGGAFAGRFGGGGFFRR